ncbi:MAG TPA: hypothetical protein VF306_03635 [Pirellulales bacterium]
MLPAFNEDGELPDGIHQAPLQEVLNRFAVQNPQRIAIGLRLERIFAVVRATGHVRRFVVFGSFITDKDEPNDVDVFQIMENSFDPAVLDSGARRLFDHAAAQAQFGASVFWLRQLACFDGEEAAVEYWQVKRGGGSRGIIEIIAEKP